jgi:2-phospho-L-lactate guanylyltransferase
MRTIAILPIKGFATAKQRLSGMLGLGSRQALAQAMFSDVLAALLRVEGLEAVVVVTGDSVAEATAHSSRVAVIADRVEAGQSAAAELGLRHARAEGFERALLVPGDTPLLDPLEVEELLERCPEPPGVSLVPDRHGEGTNAVLMAPTDAIAPSFGPGSLSRHVDAARVAGVACRLEALESLTHDVDTPDDLAALAELLESRRGAQRTRGALRQLDRMRLSASGAPLDSSPRS